ncbi:MAG TPA: TRAP transporter small permease [Burkholderiaceae bacterium]|nr:TRAP transporter small permease [Burkholderiaceae bacterium]
MKLLDRLEETLIAFLMAAATLVIFAAVAHRFLATVPVVQDLVLRMDVSWAQELCIFMFVWMAKFGAAYGVRQGIHVGVDVLVRKLPEPRRRPLTLFALLAGALFTGVVATLGGHFVARMAQTDQTSVDLEVPMWLVYLCVPLGSGLMCFRFLQVAWRFLKTGELPHHDHGHVEGMDDIDADELLTNVPTRGRA